MPLQPGQIIHQRYRIERLLGQGGFGAVYLAWDLNLQALVALKESLDASPASEKQLRSEAGLLFRLRHPNLPIVHDCFTSQDQALYLTMDYIDGESLEQMLARQPGPLPVNQALVWIAPICDSLDYLHRQSPPVIHRDIKPANIIIRQDGTPFLVDFGISKLFDPDRGTTAAAQALTPAYAPPEQYGRTPTDARSDIYALGATLYHLLTGQTPPPAVDTASGEVQPPKPPQAINPDVPSQVGQAVMKALQINRTQRWHSAGELKRALLGAGPPPTKPLGAERRSGRGAERPVVQIVPGADARQRERRPERKRRSPAWMLGGAAGLGVLGLVGIALLLGWLAGRRTPGAALQGAGTVTLPAAAASGTPTPRPTLVPSRTPTPTASPTPSSTPTVTPTLPRAGEAWVRPEDGMTMVYIPAGEFRMGAGENDPYAQSDEQPRRMVDLDAYWIDQTEVTNAMFGRFVAATGYVTQAETGKHGQIFDSPNRTWREARMANWQHPGGYQSDRAGLDNHPVVLVSWNDATRYCQWAAGRLPTEAEWEKAARGTEGRTYPWGSEFKGVRLNFCDQNCLLDTAYERLDDGWEMAAPVGSYPDGAGPYGNLDLAGNVWEWVLDWYQQSYAGLPGRNPFGPQGGSERVARGGSWADSPIEARAAYRFTFPPDTARDTLGFRCVRQ